MTTNATAVEPAPAASDIGDRVLALIKSVHDAGDLGPDNIGRQTGLAMRVDPGNPDDYGASGKLAEGWFYALRSMSPEAGRKPHRVLFQLNRQGDEGAAMAPVCIGLDTYERALTQAGFAGTRMRNRTNTQDYWEFRRDDVGVTVYVDSAAGAQPCISMLIIDAYN